MSVCFIRSLKIQSLTDSIAFCITTATGEVTNIAIYVICVPNKNDDYDDDGHSRTVCLPQLFHCTSLLHRNVSSLFFQYLFPECDSVCIDSDVHIKHELSQLKIDDTDSKKKKRENWPPHEGKGKRQSEGGREMASESNTNVSNKLFTPVTFALAEAMANTSYSKMSFFGMRLLHVFIYYKFSVSFTTTHGTHAFSGNMSVYV